eukprot:m.67481 g.67481  ORF g.67481 m.67481 type:complete len:465 (+) comp9868_c2_seq1:4090-5484(+)
MAEAAAAAAAAIAAKLSAAGKLAAGLQGGPPAPRPPAGVAGDAAEGTTAEIPINDISSSARSIVTRGPKQDELGSRYGVALTTRGRYYPPGSARPESGPDKPLHILVEAKTKEDCDRAVAGINAIIEDAQGGGGRPQSHEGGGLGFGGQYSTPPVAPPVQSQPTSAKVYLDMYMIPGFDIVGQISGPGGQYLGHIAKETGCLVELRGRGSGTVDPYTRVESSESLHLFVEHTEGRQVSAARELCQSLVTTVRTAWNEFRSKPPPQRQAYGAPPAAAYGAPQPGYPPAANGTPAQAAHGYPYYPPSMYPPTAGQVPYGVQQPYAGQWGYPQGYYGAQLAAAGGVPQQPAGAPAYNTAPPVSQPAASGAAAVAPTEAPPMPPGEAPPVPPGAAPPAAASIPQETEQPPLPPGPPPPSHDVAAAPKRKFTETTAPPPPPHQQVAWETNAPEDHIAKKVKGQPLVDYS